MADQVQQPTGGYRPQDTGATAPQMVRNQPSSVQAPQTAPRCPWAARDAALAEHYSGEMER